MPSATATRTSPSSSSVPRPPAARAASRARICCASGWAADGGAPPACSRPGRPARRRTGAGPVPARAWANTVPNWGRHFLLETAEGAHFEITMGKIAARKGHSREARAAGRVMVRDHSGELHAVQALAKTLGVKLPTAPSILQQHEIGNTSKHTGAAFDRAYARLEVEDHIVDLQSADGEILDGQLSSGRAFAQK